MTRERGARCCLLWCACFLAACCAASSRPAHGATARVEAPGRDTDSRRPDSWERGLRAQLAKRVVIGFKDATAREAFRLLEASSRIPFFLEPKLAESAAKGTVANTKISAEDALRVLCRWFLARHALCEDAVVVTRGDSDALPTTRSYDIRDLLNQHVAVRCDVLAANRRHSALNRNADPAHTMQAEQGRALKGAGWACFVRATVAPATWRRATAADSPPVWPPYVVRYRDGFLVVTHTAAVHAEVEKLLAGCRAKPSWRNLQVHILARFVRVDAGYPKEMRKQLKLQQLPTGSASTGAMRKQLKLQQLLTGRASTGASYAAVDDEAAVASLMQDIVKRRKGLLLIAPRVTCWNTQRARLKRVNYSYVRRVSSDEEPEIGNIPRSAEFEVQPFVHPDLRRITLLLDSASPGGNASASGAGGVLGWVTVRDGGSVVIEGFAQKERQTKPPTHLLVILTAQVVPDIFED